MCAQKCKTKSLKQSLSKTKLDADSSSFSLQLLAADFAAYRHG
jgi:hypothetical protein